MKKGIFITIEGGEGSGKTTLIKNIVKYLTSKNLPSLCTREPGGTKLGEEIRKILLKRRDEKVFSKAELCLFLASRSQHIEQIIKPSLKQGKIVISDRFNDSSVSYQGEARNLGIENVIKFSKYIVEDVKIDLTLYLDIDPKIGLSRVKSQLDRIELEKIDFHKKIRKGFHILAKKYPKRIKILDATKDPKVVFENALKYIEKLIR